MIKSQKIKLQKILYGTFFILVLPLYFIFLANSVSLPFEVPELGYGDSVMAIIGLAIIIRGMYELKVKGKGLPMNAFPPEELVEDGIYGIFPHPIYFGFCNFQRNNLYLLSTRCILIIYQLPIYILPQQMILPRSPKFSFEIIGRHPHLIQYF